MPRSIVEDDDDAVPLSDLLRTGEASRLRRRGAMRATAPRPHDDEEVSVFQLTRGINGGDPYLALECGVPSGEFSFIPAGPSRPSPLPRSANLRKPSDLGIVFSSTGCGALVSTKVIPGCIGAKHVYISAEPVDNESNVVHLSPRYLIEPEHQALSDIMKATTGLQGIWEPLGCRVCGNPLGLIHVACDLQTGRFTSSSHLFFPSSVTPSPDFIFPPPPQELDDISVDSPTLSPRVTRYFRADDELWPSEMNRSWEPDRGFTPTPPRSPPTAATPLTYTAWQGVQSPPVLAAPTQTLANRTTSSAPRHSESTQVPAREQFNAWQSLLPSVSPHRSVSPRRTEPPPAQNTNNVLQSEDLPSLPPETSRALPHERRERASLEHRSLTRTDTWETSFRSLEPPSLHRVARRPMPTMRRPTSLIDWTSRGRHNSTSDGNPSWSMQGSDERFSRRAPRRITMTMPTPTSLPTFTLLDAFGERSYPPSAMSSLDVRDTLGVSMEVETEEAAIAHWLQERHSGTPERSWNHHPDGENEVGADDNEEKEDDLDERRVERTSRNNIARSESHSSNLRGLILR